MPICERLKYGGIFLTVIITLLVLPIPKAQGESEHSLETGVAIRKTLENEQPNWETIVEQQLKRREAQIELARIAEETRKLEEVEKARKARETVRETRKIVRVAQSFANDMSYGQCTYWAKSKRPDLPTGLGNANTWYSRARAMGFAVGAAPRIGAVATTTRGVRGHVSIVEQIKGNMIYVSEMNVHGVGVLSYAWYPASDYQYIY